MSDIKMEFVESSQLNAIGYADGVMAVQFRTGAVWHYANVPQEKFDEVKSAQSVGKAFILTIRDIYPATKQAA